MELRGYKLKLGKTGVLLWNAILCTAVVILRSLNEVKDENDNFFQFNAGFAIYLSSLIFYMAYSMLRAQEGFQPDSLLLWIVFPFGSHMFAILFGAPFFKNWDMTLTYALIQSSLILPVLLTNKIPTHLTPEILHHLGLVEYCSIFGAWCSSVVIPLDWDRPWQVWPEPCCFGAVVGCLIGSTGSLMIKYLYKNELNYKDTKIRL